MSAAAAAVKRVAAIILAAGLSSRTAPHHKLLARDEAGESMVGRVVRSALGSRAESVVVVTGHRAGAVEAAARESAAETPRLRFVNCAGYAGGISASVAAGIAEARDCDAALICLADMPLVTAALMDQVIDAYLPAEGPAIVVPACGGRRGNPVLWSGDFFPALGGLTGDQGGRSIMQLHPESCRIIETGDPAVLQDFDDAGPRF